ncbi:pyridine nucleotide transhydrogenase [Glaciecola petra]|uniref:Pyridine nucleotide transhydrogenase n=1 Tax=Glaciecola petra TaxID=3075602 RepID=A0ABU2ZVT8_9ALTE|nr:pyridine nucleotide transhydrogenase [Aestuariibacter sp. P117]MDT0596525.1 pyridine nucleotide transhydrogenase [Aestuariibacter sp. P117]
MKPSFLKTTMSILLVLASNSLLAESALQGETKAFKCMNKQSFEINSNCMQLDISSNLVFKKAESNMYDNINGSSDRVLASMTFNPKLMEINIVAHKDATLAKVVQ